jgi:hypothetical protein
MISTVTIKVSSIVLFSHSFVNEFDNDLIIWFLIVLFIIV